MIRRLAERLFRLDPEKQDDGQPRPGGFTRTVISSNTRLKQPMLTRWRIVQSRRFGLYVHEWHRPDSDKDCHNHPWWFGTLILRGGYTEERRENPGKRYSSTSRVQHRRFRWHTTPLDVAHRVVELEPNTWTLLLVGPKVRNWGFYVHGRQVVADRPLRPEEYGILLPSAAGWGVYALQDAAPRYVPWQTYIAQGGNADPLNVA